MRTQPLHVCSSSNLSVHLYSIPSIIACLICIPVGLAMNQIEMEKVVDVFDHNRDGMINLNEILSVLKGTKRRSQPMVTTITGLTDAEKIDHKVCMCVCVCVCVCTCACACACTCACACACACACTCTCACACACTCVCVCVSVRV